MLHGFSRGIGQGILLLTEPVTPTILCFFGHSKKRMVLWLPEQMRDLTNHGAYGLMGQLHKSLSYCSCIYCLYSGPGSSSLYGLILEVRIVLWFCIHWHRHLHVKNGPIHVAGDYSISANNYSWDKLADYIWLDQPVYVFINSCMQIQIEHIPTAELDGQPLTLLVMVTRLCIVIFTY